MASVVDAIRTGNVSTRFGLAGTQVARDGFRVDTPIGSIDTRDTPIHNFMRNMDQSEGFMRPTQFQMRFNLDESMFRSRPGRQTDLFGSSNPLSAIASGLQTGAQQVSDFVAERTGFGAASPSTYEAVNINCHAASIPAETFSMADDQKLAGRNRQYPVARAYSNEVTLSFYVSRDAFERYLFDDWQNLIIPHHRHAVQYPDKYTKDIELVLFKNDTASTANIPVFSPNDEVETYKIHFQKAYPVAIREIQLDYSNTNQIVSMDVTFYFERAIEDKQLQRADETNNNSAIGPLELLSSFV